LLISASDLLVYDGDQQKIVELAGITVDKLGKSANNGMKAGFGDDWPVQSKESGSGLGVLI